MAKKKIEAYEGQESDLHKIVSAKWDLQETRLRLENKFHGTKNNVMIGLIERLKGDIVEICPKCHHEHKPKTAEEFLNAHVKKEVMRYPIHQWIIGQKGLSYDMAGQLVGIIENIKDFSNISKLWAYFGLAVVDVCENCGKRYYPPSERVGKILHIAQRLMDAYEARTVKEGKSDFNIRATEMVCTCREPKLIKSTQKAKKGILSDFNPRAKSLAHKVGTQFIKQGTFYRDLYDQFKAEYEQRPDLKKEIAEKKGRKVKGKNGTVVDASGTAHIHRMAMRRMEKVFLAHLWLVWRELDGLPTTKPFVIDQMKHTNFIEPPAPAAKDILAGTVLKDNSDKEVE